MPGKAVTLLIAALAALPAAAQESNSFTIVEEGRCDLAIYTEREPIGTHRYAAKELQRYVKKMTEAALAIREEEAEGPVKPGIYVGATRAARELGVRTDGLKPDGFVIAAPRKDVLILAGHDHRGPPLPGRPPRSPDKAMNGDIPRYGQTGTLFAVYRLLHDQGVRWFLPGEIGEVVPDKATLRVTGLPLTDAPHYTYRNRNAFNFDADAEAAAWYRRAGFGAEHYVWINHNYKDWAGKYGKDHPEYFAIIDGKRDNDPAPRNGKSRNIVDFTEPGVFETTLREAEEYFRRPHWPGGDPLDPRYRSHFSIYPVMPNDSFRRAGDNAEKLGLLTPARGFTGAYSDYVWSFVNKVALEIYRRHPGRLVGAAAYSKYRDPPLKLKRLAPNIAVMYVTDRTGLWSKEYRDRTRLDLLAYRRLQPAAIYVWTNGNSPGYRTAFMSGMPRVMPRAIAEDIRFLRDLSAGEFVAGSPVYSEQEDDGTYKRKWAQHLNDYVTAKCLWDPKLDVELLLHDYYEKFWGPAAEPVRAFFNRLESNWMDPARHEVDPATLYRAVDGDDDALEEMARAARFKGKRLNEWKRLWPPEEVRELFGHLAKARELAPPESVYRKRLDALEKEFSIMKEKSGLGE